MSEELALFALTVRDDLDNSFGTSSIPAVRNGRFFPFAGIHVANSIPNIMTSSPIRTFVPTLTVSMCSVYLLSVIHGTP